MKKKWGRQKIGPLADWIPARNEHDILAEMFAEKWLPEIFGHLLRTYNHLNEKNKSAN